MWPNLLREIIFRIVHVACILGISTGRFNSKWHRKSQNKCRTWNPGRSKSRIQEVSKEDMTTCSKQTQTRDFSKTWTREGEISNLFLGLAHGKLSAKLCPPNSAQNVGKLLYITLLLSNGDVFRTLLFRIWFDDLHWKSWKISSLYYCMIWLVIDTKRYYGH